MRPGHWQAQVRVELRTPGFGGSGFATGPWPWLDDFRRVRTGLSLGGTGIGPEAGSGAKERDDIRFIQRRRDNFCFRDTIKKLDPSLSATEMQIHANYSTHNKRTVYGAALLVTALLIILSRIIAVLWPGFRTLILHHPIFCSQVRYIDFLTSRYAVTLL
jgi:hypothetical protein